MILSVRGGAPIKEVPLPQCSYSPALLRAQGAADYLRHLLAREKRALAGMERARTADDDRLLEQRVLVEHIEQALEELV